ncbi:LuxR C-terminal-related transcriptional regulator [Georgenia satyanarayanai]|uniref:helix-turn-helix transcriptional regulator n=1 Tax=Georgenia satyanarayanai TaxID=860221 RepID=UPI00203AAD12|nr:LuxR C-terminal-related transcriptional regulator [Georgenia satyanarayanai]MCM3660817.1 LuxR C-terminal-related transcriptional regulator [Georgenia satyanarayanai]
MNRLGRRVHGPFPRASRAAYVAPRVLDALGSRAPLTVLRGPRGFGKTTALVEWLTGEDDGVPTVYVPLDEGSRLAPGFWATLRTALTAADLDGYGSPEAQDDPDRAAVLGSLLRREEPLRLVVDNYHEAGHLDGRSEIDDELLELVRSSAALELVVCTRSLRALETTGALSVDLTVVRPADLAMRAEDVLALAERHGVSMTVDGAADLAMELGGWPAAVRTCIATAGVGGREAAVDTGTVDGFIETLLADVRSTALREFLMRTAVPEEFSAAAARAIVPDGTALRELRNLRVGGLLRERETVEGLRYSYPPAIRDALRRVSLERHPHLEREVHIALMALAAQEEGPVGVLRHAVLAQEWDTALRIIEEEWSALLTQHPHTLIEIAGSFPREIADGDPRLQVVRRHLPRMAPASADEASEWTPVRPHFVVAAVKQRWAEKQETTDEIHILIQSGLAAVFAGEHEAAAYAFERVRDHGLRHDDRTARLVGIGGMLTAKTFHGETDLALRLLEDEELADVIAGGEGDEVSRLVRVGGRIMRAIATVDGMRPEVHEAVADIVEPGRRDELWALAIHARGLYSSVYGTPEDQARVVGQLRAALRHLEPGGIAESTIGTQLVELLVAGGMVDVAEQVLDRLVDGFVSSSTRAYLLHAQGREQEAIDIAARDLGDRRMTARSRLINELIIAAALFRLGQGTAARRRFARGVRIAYETGQRRPFALISPEIFGALAGNDPELLALRPLPSTTEAQRPQAVPSAPAVPSELSARELQVLAALQDSAGPAGVAAALGMSVNTAKTHLRHVYRKLGASSRDEALVLSRGLGRERR